MKNYSNKKGVFGNEEYKKESIVSVEVLDTLENAPEDAWDVSESENGSVKAWVEKAGKKTYTLYLAADGGINLQDAAEGLFCEYTELETINLNGHLRADYTVSTKNMFKNCESVVELDLSTLNTGNTKDMSNMFENCKKMTSVILSDSFDTSNVVSMKSMFDGCFKLESLDLSGFDTKKVEDMSYMFYKCRALETLDLSSFVTPRLVTVEKMFYECKSLSQLDMSNLNCKDDDLNTDDMFGKCPKLKDFVTDSDVIRNKYELSR